MSTNGNSTDQTKLKTLDKSQIKMDLNLEPPSANLAEVNKDDTLEKKAEEFVDQIIAFTADNHDETGERKNAVEDYGSAIQRKAAKQTQMLKQPLKDMSRQSEDGGGVAKSLIDLKVEVESLDPAKFNFEPGWMTRTLGFLPFIGTPMKKYFSKYESAQTAINAIIHSLEKGRDELTRDNTTLNEDQKLMRESTHELQKAITVGQLMDQKLSYRLERDIGSEDPRHKFIKEELLFPLRQRIMDLQQQLAVNQQGVLATEVLMRNNRELIRGVNRALNVTVSALEVAVTVAVALTNQEIVLKKIDALTNTTNSLIGGTAERLKTQGAEIQKRAASSQLDIETLKQAFLDINTALEDISTFRSEALPHMAETIIEMDQLTEKAEESIQKMEESSRAEGQLSLSL
ncbi:MAG: toxic anion resistance protein [Bdellovibrionales bacterium]|nr:toxic anion resistance protein [Bdellovibrionales bacterium]